MCGGYTLTIDKSTIEKREGPNPSTPSPLPRFYEATERELAVSIFLAERTRLRTHRARVEAYNRVKLASTRATSDDRIIEMPRSSTLLISGTGLALGAFLERRR
jgi:hypothetical protein